MLNNLENKIAIITGSARGIGFSIAETFADSGATVVILDLFQDAVDEAVTNLTSNGKSAYGYAVDVTDSENVDSIFKEIHQKFGKIDILINNAGITKDGLIMKMKESDWDAVLNVNLKGTFICTQIISRYMLRQREGVILNIASVIGIMGNAGQSNYAASKGGVIAFTKSSAKEFASRNIRVNAIAPGFIETEMTAKLPEDVINKYKTVIPLKKLGSTKDVANLLLFLASEQASYITGQTINVDGGMIM
ncbi:MAG: 3-oxoacyl-[acyl-carrier-protein] reductase [Candidatus Marinimicrobia bacterium]|nr:3-oxoacyl-[acyl-carrier-protein] reductase [Candidatus Neomarinimicrobiota bacterium]MBL7023433.1 3-oxoacyl-[acyl-carrier-protein] reductase [Candidatus Neomarinimicrobiota bacterium]MBL7108818.1 3-oxoacyl-[acyl-carrier-protein] reductase [Candidatus Neomarinimicrobiota bacterium]